VGGEKFSDNSGVFATCPVRYKPSLIYAIRRVGANQEGLKSNGTHQLVVYADNDNILGGIIHTI
jgi:hypothetical protein